MDSKSNRSAGTACPDSDQPMGNSVSPPPRELAVAIADAPIDPPMNLESMQLILNYAERQIERDDAALHSYRGTVDKLMTLHVILFAAMAYGLQWIERGPRVTHLYLSIVLFLGASAAAVLVFAFGIGLKCRGLQSREMAGSELLIRDLTHGINLNKSPEAVCRGLALSMLKVSSMWRGKQAEQTSRNKNLNSLTIAGLILVALFLVVAIGGKFFEIRR